MADKIKFLLDEEDIPKSWYNIVSDLPYDKSEVAIALAGLPSAA